MPNEIKRLQVAFLQKEENQKYLSNLESLKSQGRVTGEQYMSLKSGYQQAMTAAVTEIANVKSQLKYQLQISEQNLNSLKTEQESLRLRRDVGELSPEAYQSSEQKLLKKIGNIQKDIADLQKLIAAKSSIETGAGAVAIGGQALSKEPAKRGPMQWVALIWGILSFIGMCVAFFPFLGSLNWVNIPFSGIGFLLCLITMFTSKGSKWFNIIGAILCFIAILFGPIRLIIGGGLF